MTHWNELSRRVEEELKRRFLSPDGILYDYAGPAGEVILPLPGECRDNFPNPFGWWTPIENGAFFTGDYLLGILRNLRRPAAGGRGEFARTLLHGLFLLQDRAQTEGCILRGIGADGSCHYPASSCDQVVPWLLSLYEFLRHPASSELERAECRERLLRLLTALQKCNWTIPGDIPGYDRGSFLSGDTPEAALVSSVNLLLATAVMADLSGEATYRELHRRVATEPLPFGKSRVQILNGGTAGNPLWMGWFLTHTVYAMRLLTEISFLAEVREAAHCGLLCSGRHFLEALPEWKRYRGGREFSPDWRICKPQWRPHSDCKTGEQIALRELPLWNGCSPCIKEEKNTIRHSLSAAWIVLLTGEPEWKRIVHEELAGFLEGIPLEALCDCSFYLLENILSEWEIAGDAEIV